MNIKVQCCGIILMLVLFFFYKKQRKIYLDTQKAFKRVFFMTFICIILDILSVVAIEYTDNLPMLFVELVCKSYLVTLVLMCLFAVLYICVDVYGERAYRSISWKYTAVTFIGVIAVLILPIQYFHNKETGIVYTHGASAIATYVSAVGLIISAFILLWRKKANIHAKRREAVMVWMLIYIVSAAIQFVFPELLLVGYAAAIGMMVLYLKLENPETNLDRQSGLFNQNAWYEYTQQLYDKKSSFGALFMFFSCADSNMQVKSEAFREAYDFLANLPDIFVFEYMEEELILIFKDKEKAEESMKRLQKRFEAGFGKKKQVVFYVEWIYLADSLKVTDAKDMIHLISHVRQSNKEFLGDDIFLVSDDMIKQMYFEIEMEQTVKEAVEEERIEVFYQPIFSTKDKRFTSAEALVRIRDKEGKLVPPGAFIRIAEENGMILQVGEIVFRKVCQFIKEHSMEEYGLDYIEVNLSVVQCAYEHLAQDFIGIMEHYQIPPKYINLEITESASLQAKKTLLDNMKQLMDYGVQFSLDDFGTGQSNLNYIVDMPVALVKFDKDMTNAYFENGKAKYVMDAAMHMIHGMQLEIVSEGIETKTQYEEMERLGISFIQGYYFSKPLPETEFLQYLETAG